jgi:Protein of unknown function (DUF4127)
VSRVALLPLDDRPVNYDHPWWLGRAAGIDVRRPSREWLGNPFRKADSGRLSAWLRDEGRSADAVVVAIDTLGYGGLIPSRQSAAPLDEVVHNLEPLEQLRAERPELSIFAFNILMRINRSNSAEEEKPYWAKHGADLFRLSYLEDKANVGDASPMELEELRQLGQEIPREVVVDYREGRARNHSINLLMLDWAEHGVLTYVVIAQDDTAPYGWNIAESRVLRNDVAHRRLDDRAIVYPGADEVASLLVAAFACRADRFWPKVCTRYSSAVGPTIVTEYEDRPLEQLIEAHLGPLEGTVTTSVEEADLVIALNAPRDETGDAADVDALAKAIEADVAAGRNVAVVDVAFVNGADLALAERLLKQDSLVRLGAYSAWNTAGNSLGSALAQGVIRAMTLETDAPDDVLLAHVALLAIHLLDDYAYQAIVRSEVMREDLPALGLAPTYERLPGAFVPLIEKRIGERMARHVIALARQLGATTITNGSTSRRVSQIEIGPPSLPWNRVFEVAITPRIEIA